jgi:hypothetical protein
VKAHASAGLEATRYFRVPPHKVYLTETIKYDNLAAEERRYVDEALCPIFEVVEEGFGKVLLTKEERREFFFRFDREQAYTSDPEIRQKIIESRWKSGLITKNEARKANGLNAIGDAGEVYMVSGNFVLTDLNNEVILKAGGNQPGSDETNAPAEQKTAEIEQARHLKVVK